MSLYAIGREVWCKSQQCRGVVMEANYQGRPRRATYIVELLNSSGRRIGDYMTGSRDLRAADWCCDGCGRWNPGYPHRTAPDGEYPNGLQFCFLCVEGLT